MSFIRAMVIAASLCLLGGLGANAGEVFRDPLKNRELTLDPDGRLKQWKIMGKAENVKLSNDTVTKPEDLPHSLRLDVLRADPNTKVGEISQEVRLEANTDYILKAWIKNTVNGLGYLQVKGIYPDKRKAGLATQDPQDENAAIMEGDVSLPFNTGDCTRIIITFRYRQGFERFEEETAWFANVRIEPANGAGAEQ